MRTHRERSQNREDMRLLLAEAERALSKLLHPGENGNGNGNQRWESFSRGVLLFSLSTLYSSVSQHRAMFSPAEFRSVLSDLSYIAEPSVSPDAKLLVIGRLRATKAFLPEPHRVPSI